MFSLNRRNTTPEVNLMSPSYTIPALVKTFDIIECISRHPDGLPFMEIVHELGIPKSTVFRILHTLETNSWVEKRGERYQLGYMFIHYGMTTLSKRKIADVAEPILKKLTEDTGETSHLAVPSGKKSMILETFEAKQHIKFTSTVGNLLPMHCTSHGKIFLAHRIGKDLDAFFYGENLERYTANTITDIDKLEAELEKIRTEGRSLDNEEYHENIRCCAAPVFGNDGSCIAAVGITGTTITVTPERLGEISDLVKTAAGNISRNMGRAGK